MCTVFALIITFSFSYTAFATEKPSLVSETAILMDADTGQILYEKNMHLRKEPASITKIPTVYLSTVYSTPDAQIVVSKEDGQLIPGSSHISLLDGEVVSMEQVQHAAMLMSANDACNVIARAVAGTYTDFANLMNEFARSAGAINTNFSNAHGLPEPTHVTTAYDMAMITKAAIQNADFNKIFSTVTYTMNETNMQPVRYFAHGDDMMKSNDPNYYQGIIGGKNGWTEEARHTKVTVAERGGRTLIAVVMNSPLPNDKYVDSAKLLDYGFTQFSQTIFTPSYFEAINLPVMDGVNDIGTATVSLPQGCTFLLPNSVSISEVTYSHVLPEVFTQSEAEEGEYYLTVALPDEVMYPATFTLPLRIEFDPAISIVAELPFEEQAMWVAKELARVSGVSFGIMFSVFAVITIILLIRKGIILLIRFINRKRYEAKVRAKKQALAKQRRDETREAERKKAQIIEENRRRRREFK